MSALTIEIPRDESLLWCKRLYWMEKGHRDGGHKEAADVCRELYDIFFRAAIDQLTPQEVAEMSQSERIDTFPEFLDD